MILDEQLQQILPRNKHISELATALNEILPKYVINTPVRIAGFLGQCAVESIEFTVLEENLNYDASGLMRVWPKLFPTSQIANAYAHQPQKIANHTYANRMGNGTEASGDGWTYHGRGAIQTTGKANYVALANHINKSLPDTVEYCKTIGGAVESACYYWMSRNLNAAADAKDIKKMTLLVNGGLLGLIERTAYWNKALTVLGAK